MSKKTVIYFILLMFLFTNTVWAKEAEISGQAMYTDEIPLPKDAKFEVFLEDISLMDAPSISIGETSISPAGQIPIAFTIKYDDENVTLGRSYAVRAKITQNDKLLYTTDTVNPVFTSYNAKKLNLVMKRIYKVPESKVMEGMYKYMADAALFKECMTGKYYPVAFEADNLALEEAYSKEVNASGEFLKVELKGKIVKRPKMDGEGDEDTLLVEQFIGIEGKQNCEEQHDNVPIANNYWKVLTVYGKKVKVLENAREAHILLKQGLNGVGELKIVTGCNVLKGSYKIEDQNIKITVKPLEGSEKVCADTEMEKNFLESLKNAIYWKIKGEELTLLDERDNILVTFKAVFF